MPVESRTQAVLTAELAAELARLGVQIEQLYGQPMDIEWAMHRGQFFVLQARPITTLWAVGSRPSTIPERNWTPPKPRGPYLRVGVIELLPDPLSPLFATLGLSVWNEAGRTGAQAMGPAVSGLLSGDLLITVRGYAYLDLTFTRTVKIGVNPRDQTAHRVKNVVYSEQRILKGEIRWAEEFTVGSLS